jgi:uncharacterized cupredoxin-like copper-binding protein
MHLRTRSIVALALATVAVAACGGTESPSVGSEPQAQVIEVVATEFAFSPATIRAPGEQVITLRLRNDGAVVHNIDIPDLGVFVDAQPGQTTEVTFTVSGTGPTTFFCNIPGHREAGMEGTLTAGG